MDNNRCHHSNEWRQTALLFIPCGKALIIKTSVPGHQSWWSHCFLCRWEGAGVTRRLRLLSSKPRAWPSEKGEALCLSSIKPVHQHQHPHSTGNTVPGQHLAQPLPQEDLLRSGPDRIFYSAAVRTLKVKLTSKMWSGVRSAQEKNSNPVVFVKFQ